MTPTLIIGAVAGVYAVITGTVRLLQERRAMRREARPVRLRRVAIGAVGVVLGIVLLVLTVLLATEVLH